MNNKITKHILQSRIAQTNFIDGFLNSITMYRLVVYGLISLAVASVILSYFGKLGYNWPVPSMLFSLAALLVACYFSNLVFSKIIKIPTNAESSLITAFILFLIMPLAMTGNEIAILMLGGVTAMASKYLIAPFRKHIFNPTALAAFILYISGLSTAVWWVGDPWMTPFVLVIGLLVVRKTRRFAMFFSFIAAWLISLALFGRTSFSSFQSFLFAIGPILFFATIMLTEPITTPPTRKLQSIYGGLVGFLLNMNFSIGGFAATPEFILIIGNLFSYITGFRRKLVLSLKEKRELAKNIQEFTFTPDQAFSFKSGQYLEWTLAHEKMDSRGNRRYFTIASSPTEKNVKLGVKYNSPPSSFKNTLFSFSEGDKIFAGQLGGDFILPHDARKKLVFLAGGIGITPFRSMVKYLLDRRERRDVFLFYAAKSDDEVAYRDVFSEAQVEIGLKMRYVIGSRLDAELLKQEVPDYSDRIFYISGPIAMVNGFKKMLLSMGVSRLNIVTDYFPGFV